MPNLRLISPINLQSADVVNLFYSSDLLLSQLLEVGKGKVCVGVQVCMCLNERLTICRYLFMHMTVCFCICRTCASVVWC